MADFEFLVHGSGVPNADCGSYPTIKIRFTITFTRTADDGGQRVNWAVSNMWWNSGDQGNGKFGYPYQICVLVNGSSFKTLLSKGVTTGTNWESSVNLYNPNDGFFLSTLDTTNVAIYARNSSDGGCYHGAQQNKPCYSGNAVFDGTHYTCLYDVGGVGIPTYETKYTVSYQANGGNQSLVPGNQEKSSLGSLTLSNISNEFRNSYPLTVTYSGISSITANRPFNSWLCSADGSYYSPGGQYNINSACTMTAQWGAITFIPPAIPVSNYVVTYDYNYNGIRTTQTLNRPALGYSLTGSTPAQYYPNTQYTTSSNLTLYPLYQNPVLSYASLPQPTRPGFTFGGWFTQGGTRVTTDLILTGNITLVAHWSPISYYHFDAKTNKWIPHTAEKVYKFNASLNKWEKVAPVYLYSNGWINISQE